VADTSAAPAFAKVSQRTLLATHRSRGYPEIMSRSELAHLEMLAEIDSLVDRLKRWADDAPAWQAAERCRALVRRLIERSDSLRIRLDAPLVVATLGGSGTGKSALVNALLGAEVVQTGRSRPTTMRPTLICRPGLTPEMLGIDPASVERIERDLPALRDLVLVDCPDPDTTEERGEGRGERGEGTPASDLSLSSALSPPSDNLARLRAILPKCDVLLVTGTQQKYRSARVAEELTAAACGTHLVFVQTHADRDADVRDDWREVLEKELGEEGDNALARWGGICTATPGDDSTTAVPTKQMRTVPFFPHIFRIDSLRALADTQANLQPRGEFADLLDLLTRQMAGAAGNRIRRANFLDLVAATLDSCSARIDEALPSVRQTLAAVEEQRGLLAKQLAGRMQSELLANRRQWENRLLGQAASRWGFSPFALVLRAYQGLGSLFAGALLYRARTPAQMALWGALEGARTWRRRQQSRHADRSVDRVAATGWESADLRKAALIVQGYVAEAGFSHQIADVNVVAAEAETAATAFVARAAGELESLVARSARRHTGWFTRWRYEILLALMIGVLLFRLGKNFFYDSWLADKPQPMFGIEFYVSAGLWLLLWCLLLLWGFCSRLRRGLRGEIAQLAASWNDASVAGALFASVETECRRVERFRQELDALRQEVVKLQRQLAAG
jgi:hypothetical protein